LIEVNSRDSEGARVQNKESTQGESHAAVQKSSSANTKPVTETITKKRGELDYLEKAEEFLR